MQVPAHASIRRAASWMAGWLCLMIVIAVAGREAARELSVFQIMLMRSTLGMAMLWPLVRAAGGLAAVRTRRLPQHALRNAIHYAAQYGWFVALTLIPLAQVVAIEFTMPIWSAALAVIFLGERMNALKWLAVLLGLIGVAVIVRPHTGEPDIGQLIALSTAVGFAISVVLVKSLTRTDAAVAISFWMLVVQSVIGLVPALLVWQWPSATVWGWVVVVAFCGTYSHFCFAKAMQNADTTVVVPMDFLRVPLTALVGWLAYGETLDIFTALGVGLILAANVLNLVRWPGRSKPSEDTA
ncbi:MAG: DMT family transporter [Betaproteobacteria bacterium]|nr:DMT family transporter [Betaproteobacteria bacterium]